MFKFGNFFNFLKILRTTKSELTEISVNMISEKSATGDIFTVRMLLFQSSEINELTIHILISFHNLLKGNVHRKY